MLIPAPYLPKDAPIVSKPCGVVVSPRAYKLPVETDSVSTVTNENFVAVAGTAKVVSIKEQAYGQTLTMNQGNLIAEIMKAGNQTVSSGIIQPATVPETGLVEAGLQPVSSAISKAATGSQTSFDIKINRF